MRRWFRVILSLQFFDCLLGWGLNDAATQQKLEPLYRCWVWGLTGFMAIAIAPGFRYWSETVSPIVSYFIGVVDKESKRRDRVPALMSRRGSGVPQD